MTEAELKALLKEHGWYLSYSGPYTTRYAHAKRRLNGRMVTRYLITERKLDQLTRERVLQAIGVEAKGEDASDIA